LIRNRNSAREREDDLTNMPVMKWWIPAPTLRMVGRLGRLEGFPTVRLFDVPPAAWPPNPTKEPWLQAHHEDHGTF
jgi:hypothetical protein